MTVRTFGQEVQWHGHTANGKPTSEYRSWSHMIRRCYTEKSQRFANYGGRGITVCDRWRESFPAFLADMGPKPSRKHSVDRIDVNGHYEPGNCRWATSKEQANNKSTSWRLTFYGLTKSAAEWSEISQVNQKTIRNRLRAGWSEKRAVWTPAGPAHNQKQMRPKAAV